MKKEEIMNKVFGLIEDVLDTLIEVGNGTTDEMLHEAADKLFMVRDLLEATEKGLVLPIKKKWYAMILSGEKEEKERMNIGKATSIFKNITSEEFSGTEKIQAIREVLNMPTHNGISKEQILFVLDWLWNQHCMIEIEIVTEEEAKKRLGWTSDDERRR